MHDRQKVDLQSDIYTKVSAGFPTETFVILEPMMLFHQTEFLHESLRLRIVSAEVAVDHSLILCATL